MKIQQQIPVSAYKPDGFILKYQKLVRETVIPYQYSVLCDEAPNTEKSHVIQNFINAAGAVHGGDIGDGFYGMVFQDSDAAKWIEAAAYSLAVYPDEKLEETVDKVIELIAKAQDYDGYLNTYYTVKDKDKRWTNLLEGHELYCSGHMMEAACAYFEATGKRTLLDVMLKNAEHIYDVFITNGHEGCPGHPEVELALMKMYRTTGNRHCLELAEHFLKTRGQDPHYYEKEAKKRNWTVWNANPSDGDYQQSGKPLTEQTNATGHAVRAVYLFTGAADYAAETNDKEMLAACRTLWDSVTKKRMYITGGIGSTVLGEAFSTDYDLPCDTAYAETCASIGLMFFASRMLENEVKGEYADVMECAFYNTVLAGMQLDGKRFFYVNPLEIVPGISGTAQTHRHTLTQRPKWYTCACCPPNAARLISSLGKYAYGESAGAAYCHLYAAGNVSFKNGVQLECRTNYPYGFDISYRIIKGGRIALRIPSWSRKYTVSINGAKLAAKPENGYVYINADDGDEIKLVLDDTPRFVRASVKVPRLTGKTALCRGPLVYCFEGTDNDGDVLSLLLKTDCPPNAEVYDENLLSGVVKITASAVRRNDCDSIYSDSEPEFRPCTAAAIPYYTWGNRGENQMRVWLNEK